MVQQTSDFAKKCKINNRCNSNLRNSPRNSHMKTFLIHESQTFSSTFIFYANVTKQIHVRAYAIRIVVANFSFYLQLCYSNNEKVSRKLQKRLILRIYDDCHFSLLVFHSETKGKFVGEIQYISSARDSIAYIQNTYFYRTYLD